MAEFKLDNSDMRKVLVTVTIPRKFRFRVWLGTQIVKLGVRVIGMRVAVNHECEWCGLPPRSE